MRRAIVAAALAVLVASPARPAERAPRFSIDQLLATAKLGTTKRLSLPADAALDRAWIVDGVVGAGRIRTLEREERFEDAMLADLAELQFRCSGVLDAEFSMPREVRAARVATATLDCKSDRPSVVSVVYVLAGHRFATLLHEGEPAQRDAILEKQARLARALDQTP